MEDSKLKQAEGYVQLLIQEGKLEQEIVSETAVLFDLSPTEAKELITNYKKNKPTEYRQNIRSNIWYRITLLIPLFFFSLVYFVLGFESNMLFFHLFAVLIVLSILGVLAYCIKLIAERYDFDLKLSRFLLTDSENERKNVKGFLIFLFFIFCVLIISANNYYFKRYLYTDLDLLTTEKLVLSEDVRLEKSGGKGGYYYYSIHIKHHDETFRWKSSQHLYAFNFLEQPNQLLKKGDSIQLILSPKEYKSNKDNIFISDIKFHNKKWIDQVKRNQIAKVNSFNSLKWISIIFTAMVLFGILRLVYISQMKRS